MTGLSAERHLCRAHGTETHFPCQAHPPRHTQHFDRKQSNQFSSGFAIIQQQNGTKCPERRLPTRSQCRCTSEYFHPRAQLCQGEIGAVTLPRIGKVTMTTLREHDNCNYLLTRARLAGNGDAVRRFSEHRNTLIKQIASSRTHLRPVETPSGSVPCGLTCPLPTLGVTNRARSQVWRYRSAQVRFGNIQLPVLGPEQN